ncbi:MAG: peptide chain release factor N(5)-glutamine methyltransferase [Candidatus Latescibacterota bacterium]|nr:MAG: peptide chain release factor N(5)-glutamine methyltransferase [Candidatus Latescibacterota bacterium]
MAEHSTPAAARVGSVSPRTWTALELLQTTARYFEEHRVEAPRLAAERLLAHVLACRRVDLYLSGDRVLAASELDRYRELVRKRASGEPLQYLVGETEFMGLTFHTDRRALIPRPETEILVDALAKRFGATATPVRFLELGCGSGALAVSLAVLLPHAEVWSSERSPQAATLALSNARRHEVAARVHVLVMDRFTALAPELAGGFHCVVSNPPYVSSAELGRLPAIVRDHEPLTALDGGPDGLDYHRALCDEGLQFLCSGGTLAVEIGAEQGDAVRRLFEAARLNDTSVIPDYAGHPRVVLGQR